MIFYKYTDSIIFLINTDYMDFMDFSGGSLLIILIIRVIIIIHFCYFLIISTSPFSFSLMILEGVWGLCSWRRLQQM